MTHDEAINDEATERYVLEEMTDEERDAFEEHYFDCAVCTEDVKAAISIRDGLAAERVDYQPAVVPFQPRRRALPAWLASAASVAIAVVSMYAGVVRPDRLQLARARAEADAPRIGVQYVLQKARGPEDTVAAGDHRQTISLDVDLEVDDKSPRYTFRVIDAAGKQVLEAGVDGEVARSKVVTLDVPAGKLKPGIYTLRVVGTEAVDVETYRFTIR
jgi:Putative zinc-finger